MTILEQWRDALALVVLRHPNGRSVPVLRLLDGDPPQLYVGLDETTCTSDPSKTMRDFAISCVALTYFPGARLARMWLAAAWCGYLGHELLELVTVDGCAVLDPHAEPYATNPCNRGLRDGLPVQLTPESLIAALGVVMDKADAVSLVMENPA